MEDGYNGTKFSMPWKKRRVLCWGFYIYFLKKNNTMHVLKNVLNLVVVRALPWVLLDLLKFS
eukprot:SAG31_NODE_1401_length_8497_cov_4.386640_8_plen_62_part_00